MHRLRSLLAQLVDLVTNSDTRLAEFESAMVLGSWGLWLMLPLDTFGTAQVWQTLRLIMPEWTWAIVFLLLAVAQTWANLAERLRLRVHIAASLSVFWFWVGLMAAASHPPGIIGPTALVFSCVSAIVYLKRSRILDGGRAARALS